MDNIHVIPHKARTSIGLVFSPRHAGRFISQIEKWIHSSGPEWTVSRLKAYHTAAMQWEAGDLSLASHVLKAEGIWHKVTGDSLVVKGLLGRAMYEYVNGSKPSTKRRWHAVLRFYTCIKLKSTSDRQYAKAISTIGGEPGFTLDETLTRFIKGFQKFVSTEGIELNQMVSPNLSRLNPHSSTHRARGCTVDGVGDLAYGKHTTSLLTSVWIPEELQGINPAEPLRQSLIASGADDTMAGHLSFLQEGGCKGRVIAVPNVWCQWLMEPFHRVLSDLIRTDYNSAVFDQNRGASYLTACMKHNRKLFCVDLSSATDRFPLVLQQAFLRGIGLETYADAIQSISHGNWDTGREITSYNTGQPMGLYGSFPLFHLTHVYLIRYLGKIQESRDGRSRRNDFLVLGDDVIITDPKLASQYRLVLKHFDVPVSEGKSITAHSLGQFAGFTAVNTAVGPIAYRPFKWTSDAKVNNVTNTCYSFGNKVKSWGTKWADAYNVLSMTWHLRQPDLSPLVNLFDLPEPKTDWGIDSYLLGSLVNRISYGLPYDLSDEFTRLWYTQVYLLLGQEEVLNDDPGLDLTSDPRSGGWTIQDRNRNFQATIAPEKPIPIETDDFEEILKDPSVRWSEDRHKLKAEQQDCDGLLEATKTNLFT